MSSLPPDQLVTASDLVRHFGVWQDRASRAPIYIMHRGRPRLVMTSVDLMDALCAPRAADGPRIDVDALLEAMRETVVIADRDLRVTSVSRAGHALLGPGATPGAGIARAWPSPHDFVAEAARRVSGSGISETIEVVAPRGGDRRLIVTIEPLGDGVALFGRDVTSDDWLADAAASRSALEAAFGAIGGLATVRINPRGFVEDPQDSLAALIALSRDALSSARFVTLFEMGSRLAGREALESVMRGSGAVALEASLLVNRAAPRPVRLALAPIIRGPAIEAVTALIAATG